MINIVMNAMELYVVEGMLPFSVAMLTASSTTASIAGPLCIPCQPKSVTDPWGRQMVTVHAYYPHVKAGFSFNWKNCHN